MRAQLCQLIPIDKEAVALHGVERIEQRQLNLSIQAGHLLRIQRLFIRKRPRKERGGVFRRFVFAALRGDEVLHDLVVVKGRGHGEIPRRKLGFQSLGVKEDEPARTGQQQAPGLWRRKAGRVLCPKAPERRG